ncbi:uncharacterized protein LOC132197728 isoform X4 [Neocloeon triangulifer]|uniref:uncharacterized protein LOC132197728 isoform X4 n=1 Tax=Neocloeon triangulifer TaxID=2078957 RepID=UPI00286F40C1|nr:uncharacterized protein LOC132197728 isoform X4 [Neocloeon triangulifer]XP_059477207.1 uncharacterized protein LOC132197728 isoform X4 [Neocloeon triangulifer]XP_059477208.1 uncharacterized protein LOC132197728 isoform X4 [Neocloeon triangulifer]
MNCVSLALERQTPEELDVDDGEIFQERALSRISKQKNRVRDDVEKNWPAPLNGNSDLAAIQRVTVGSAVNHCQKRKCSLVWPPPPPPLVQHEKCDSRYLDAGEIKLPAMVLEDGGVAAGMFGCIKKSGNCRVCKSLRDDEDDATLEGSVERSLEPTLWPKLRLECAGLNFDRRQLARLNLRFASFISSADDPEAGARNSYQKFQLYSQTDGDTGVERARASVEQATERLLQRLLCTVADLDARFASKFLATLASKTERAEHRPWPGRRFHYMIRLDSLSWPPLYPSKSNADGADGDESGDDVETAAFSRAVFEDGEAGVLPPGWLRVRPAQGATAEAWAEFLTPSGCLRRDRVVERFAMLLSQAAGTNADDTEADESRVCGSPGKVLDAALLQQLLCEIKPQHQLFYGPSEAQRCRPPDPRDFQVAVIHEGGSGPVLLRLGFHSPSLQLAFPPEARNVVEVQLHIGVALSGWPSEGPSFPSRLPLHHPLALLAYKSAQSGYFALAVAPPPNLRCEERRSAWAASFPGMELELDEHFCASSTPRKAVRVLRHLISKMRKEANDDDEFEGLVTVNDYTLRTLMWHQLERWTSVNAWEPASLAAHVLLALDALLANLKSRHASHFVLPDCNILCQTPLHPSLIAKYGDHEEACDAAMLEDTQLVMDCLLRLHQASTSASPLPQGVSWDGEEEVRRAAALEAALLWRWGTALNIVSPLPPAMLPPAVPWFEKIGRFILREEETIAPPPEHFSNRQIDYLAQLMLEYLRFTKSCLAPQAEAEFQNEAAVDVGSLRDSGPGGASEETEDFLFLMHAVVNQALGSSAQTVGKGSKKRRRRRQTRAQPDKQQVWRDVVCDAVRREPLAIGVLKDEIALVRHLLRWMHNATELAPRALKKKLSNFTMQLWATSREAVWHLPEWKKHRQECQDELNAMAAFCTMLLNSQEGWTGVAVLKDAAEKGWIWAKAAQSELVRSGCLQFVLAPAKGVVRRCDVALAIQPSSRDTSPSQISKKISKSCTLPARTSRTPNISQNELTLRLEHRRGSGGHGIPLIPVHQRLRDGSPLSVALDNRRRHGQQCALSSLVHAFIAMHRISVLQDVAALLPPHERQPVLDALQKLSRARRLTRMNSDVGFEEKFTMKNFEFPILDPLGRPFDDSRNENCRKKLVDAANMAINILGTCRNARTLQRRHSLYSPMGNTSLIYSTSPASIRRRHAGAPMQGIALLQLSDGGQLTLNSGSDRDTSQMF